MALKSHSYLSGAQIVGGNAVVVKARFTVFDNAGKEVPDTVGPINSYLVAGNPDRRKACQSALVGVATYTGDDGDWIITIPGNVMHTQMLPLLFADRQPLLIVEQPGISRGVIPLNFKV